MHQSTAPPPWLHAFPVDNMRSLMLNSIPRFLTPDASVDDVPERDRGLLGLVERLMKRPGPAEPAKPVVAADEGAREGLDPAVPEAVAPISLEPQIAIETTRTLRHRELSDLLLRALQATEGCPQQGLEITIYGARPWNALLRITPAAGPLRDAAAWRTRLQNTVLLFREQYELVEDDAV